VRGYAHVIKEDTVDPRLLFLGTEFGLWISADQGEHWAQFKGGHLPNVAVRDLAIQPRDNDLVLATHGRGIWIVDDITPLRHLTQELLHQPLAFVAARPVQQRIEAGGQAPLGAAAFVGGEPADGAVITYYQKSRHLFGKLKIEVLDEAGRVIDELPASARRGLNRVVWSMHLPPPRVPPAVQLAQAGTLGPRVLPGTYTIRITDNDKTYSTQLTVGLDARVKWTIADRKAQLEAAMKVYNLFNDESDVFARIAELREAAASVRALPAAAGVQRQLAAFDARLDALRRKIVATTEGGAITGEERLREHTDSLYGAILTWEGPPSAYQLENIAALRAGLTEVDAALTELTRRELPALNQLLKARGLAPLAVPPASARAADDADEARHGGSVAAGRGDPDRAAPAGLRGLRLWY
jgi:hypothetical protein